MLELVLSNAISIVGSLLIGWWFGRRGREDFRQDLDERLANLRADLPQLVAEEIREGRLQIRPTENDREVEIITARGSVTVRPPMLEMRGEVLSPTVNPSIPDQGSGHD